MTNDGNATAILLERLAGALRDEPAVRAIVAHHGITAEVADARTRDGVLELTLMDGVVLSVREEALTGVVVAPSLTGRGPEAEHPLHHPV